MKEQNIQTFILKSGNSDNDPPNNSSPNEKLRSFYNNAKTSWMLKYGSTILAPHHMNLILVEAGHEFKLYPINTIRDSFVKKNAYHKSY